MRWATQQGPPSKPVSQLPASRFRMRLPRALIVLGDLLAREFIRAKVTRPSCDSLNAPNRPGRGLRIRPGTGCPDADRV